MVEPTSPLPGLVQDDNVLHQNVLHRISEELATRFQGVFTPETVERYVFESYTGLARSAKIRAHLPAITSRFAKDRLTALAQSKGLAAKDVPEVLFVCVHNAGRSQMAAALLAHHAQGRIHVRSAGSMPIEHLEPSAVAAMQEIGLGLEEEFPKPLTDDVVRAADVVVTMGCGDSCPVYAGKRYLDWHLEDPAGKTVEQARAIRDDLDTRIRGLLNDILDR
ncbi:three-helix bundle dimerization domain-containing protein [Arthrobacter sp. Marseille-P9274]|uniref:arsenate reductase/protein-tyrosine-phosphatase family protein n=1 Tax=Arthrobacter sp. Marseille-P9274 TaxID=2866572 RepID=UPI0021C5FEB5|nr:arsenate reductase ArsC [Arthrobacter sp. Marseille-P9274]